MGGFFIVTVQQVQAHDHLLILIEYEVVTEGYCLWAVAICLSCFKRSDLKKGANPFRNLKTKSKVLKYTL